MQNKEQKVEQTTESDNSTKPLVSRRCWGRHYNFKKGMEVCPHRNECQFYEPEYEKVNRVFASVKDFRNCRAYNDG